MSDSFVTPWTAACQAPLSVQGVEPVSPLLQADSLPLSLLESTFMENLSLFLQIKIQETIHAH